jgi:hypothetical protein
MWTGYQMGFNMESKPIESAVSAQTDTIDIDIEGAGVA